MENKSSEHSERYWLYEYDTGHLYGPASQEDVAAFQKALQSGKSFLSKGHHGFELRFVVAKRR